MSGTGAQTLGMMMRIIIMMMMIRIMLIIPASSENASKQTKSPRNSATNDGSLTELGWFPQVCLDGGARDDLVAPAANPRLARSFRPADVANLLAILANPGLAAELRRSAAEQMMALAAEERLRALLEEEVSGFVVLERGLERGLERKEGQRCL